MEYHARARESFGCFPGGLPIPGDEGNYVVLLDFYHQLHCLVRHIHLFQYSMPLSPSFEIVWIILTGLRLSSSQNTIRKALHPDHYSSANTSQILPDIRIPPDANADAHKPGPGPLPQIPFNHIAHCINSIRESLMCSADITPVVWHWDERVHKAFPAFDVVHECRDYEGIKAWTLGHHLEGGFDASVHADESAQ